MLKVMTIVGTRPEIIKLSRVIGRLDRHTDHVLVHTGQNFDYELNEIFFREMRLRKPQYYLNAAGETLMETIANILVKSDAVMEAEKPDAVLIYGDTNSCLSAMAAKRRRIPIFHMEAGNRCFDQRVPEEINRKVIDHLSDINMPISEHARTYLLREGIRPETVIKIGSCMKEVLAYYKSDIDQSGILSRMQLTPKEYFTVSAHREENIDSDGNFSDFIDTLHAIGQKYDKRIIVSTHPRTMKKIQSRQREDMHAKIEWIKPVGFFDYIKLQKNAFCVISDSGTLMEEASLLSFPAVAIRNAHERPEGMDEGVLILSGLKADRVLPSIDIVTCADEREDSGIGFVPDYNAEEVSGKVVRIIAGYTDYVRRTVWREGDLQ